MGNKIITENKIIPEDKIIFDKNNDRIDEINGFKFFNTEADCPSRRNVICYSKILQLYIISNGLKNDNIKNNIKNQSIIAKLIKDNILTDIEVSEVYYG